MEEPPEDSQSMDEKDKSQQLKICNAESLEILMGKFENAFAVIEPGGYFCNRFATKLKNPSLMHCWKGAEVVKHVHKIKQLMMLKSRMEFQKDIIICLESASKLEELIKKTALSELDMWVNICHNRIHCPVRTNLVELPDLCDDLRIQVNFWSSLWKRLFYSSQIRNIFGEISNIMRKVRIQFDKINSSCFSWLRRLVIIGFRVLAHCDLDRIEYESLCNIAKGLEEFNLLIANFKLSVKRFGDECVIPLHSFTLKLSGLLELVAQERSKYSAISCKEYLFGGADFLKEVQNYNFKQYAWLDAVNSCKLELLSDRKGEVSEAKCTSPIPGMMKITDSIFSSYPPLMDFIRREKGFIENFLHAVCHVTMLLILEKRGCSDEKDVAERASKYTTSSNSVLTFIESPPEFPSSSGNKEDGSSKKKSVSWNDSSLATQANSIASQYFVKVWQCFVGNFSAFVEGFYWMGTGISGDHLGCLALSNSIMSHLVSHILHISAHKGYALLLK